MNNTRQNNPQPPSILRCAFLTMVFFGCVQANDDEAFSTPESADTFEALDPAVSDAEAYAEYDSSALADDFAFDLDGAPCPDLEYIDESRLEQYMRYGAYSPSNPAGLVFTASGRLTSRSGGPAEDLLDACVESALRGFAADLRRVLNVVGSESRANVRERRVQLINWYARQLTRESGVRRHVEIISAESPASSSQSVLSTSSGAPGSVLPAATMQAAIRAHIRQAAWTKLAVVGTAVAVETFTLSAIDGPLPIGDVVAVARAAWRFAKASKSIKAAIAVLTAVEVVEFGRNWLWCSCSVRNQLEADYVDGVCAERVFSIGPNRNLCFNNCHQIAVIRTPDCPAVQHGGDLGGHCKDSRSFSVNFPPLNATTLTNAIPPGIIQWRASR